MTESLGYAAPAPVAADVSHGSSPDAKAASEVVYPAPPSKGTEVAPLTASAPAVASPDAKAASKTVRPAAPSPATEATAPAPTAEAKDGLAAEANPASKSPGTVFAGRYEDGAAAYNRGEFAKAKRVWLPLAEQGDARAQTGLCILYFLGQGTQRNIAAALEWCGRGADQGLAAAQYELGQIYEHPWRPELQDFAEAAEMVQTERRIRVMPKLRTNSEGCMSLV